MRLQRQLVEELAPLSPTCESDLCHARCVCCALSLQNALLSVPDPNACIMKKCRVFPVEFVCRGFMTGEQPRGLPAWLLRLAGVSLYIAIPLCIACCLICTSYRLAGSSGAQHCKP
jgi:hypothetical protein